MDSVGALIKAPGQNAIMTFITFHKTFTRDNIDYEHCCRTAIQSLSEINLHVAGTVDQ